VQEDILAHLTYLGASTETAEQLLRQFQKIALMHR